VHLLLGSAGYLHLVGMPTVMRMKLSSGIVSVPDVLTGTGTVTCCRTAAEMQLAHEV